MPELPVPLPRHPVVMSSIIIVAAAELELLAGVDDAIGEELLIACDCATDEIAADDETAAEDASGVELATDEIGVTEEAATDAGVLLELVVVDLVPPPPLPPQAVRPSVIMDSVKSFCRWCMDGLRFYGVIVVVNYTISRYCLYTSESV
jgi:hypothetical protein